MAYVPDPTDVTNPTDAISAETAQAEFRALKTYIAGLAGLGGGINLFRKNKIINGNFLIDQRNVGAVVNNTAASWKYIIDRWALYGTTAAVLSCQQIAGTGVGSIKAAKLVSLAATVPAAVDSYAFAQNIEGYNIADLAWGTAGAKSIAISFIVNASVAGTYALSIANFDSSRSYVAQYTVNVANEDEYKTIVIPGCTDGVWNVDNSIGVKVRFDLGNGSNFEAPAANVWNVGANYFRIATNVKFVNTNAATIKFEQVQFEVANAASPFEFIPFSEQLELCQRYYEKSYRQSVAPRTNNTNGAISFYVSSAPTGYTYGTIFFAVEKRTDPTMLFLSYTASTSGVWSNGNTVDFSSSSTATVINGSSTRSVIVGNSSGVTVTPTGNCVIGHFTADAEL